MQSSGARVLDRGNQTVNLKDRKEASSTHLSHRKEFGFLCSTLGLLPHSKTSSQKPSLIAGPVLLSQTPGLPTSPISCYPREFVREPPSQGPLLPSQPPDVQATPASQGIDVPNSLPSGQPRESGASRGTGLRNKGGHSMARRRQTTWCRDLVLHERHPYPFNWI